MIKLVLEDFLPYRLSRAGALVSSGFREVYGPHHDLTIPEWRVLATLGQFGEMTAKAVGAHSSMHKTKVSRAVQSLEDRRWLKRRRSAVDGREELLCLTPTGNRIYSTIVPEALAFELKLLNVLGPEASAFLETLGRLETFLGLDPRRVATASGPSKPSSVKAKS
jgi:DNA-binding MarR family transcriptional regulator